MALALLGRRELDLRLVLRGQWEFPPSEDPKMRNLLPFLDANPEGEVDFHIRHHWPPNFNPPPSGRWILAQPWEFGSLPEKWVSAFRETVDDVWCFTRYVRDCYHRAGFNPQRTHIVPHGIDPELIQPGARTFPLPTQKGFKFLFVGGTLTRKGADILLDAYLRAFSPRDDVALLVKDTGTKTFYLNQTMGDRFIAAGRDPSRPEIVYIDGHLSEGDLACLYAACDALVAPYRGEGFALPVLEAMASGLPVIVPCGGATDDFVDGTCGLRVASNRMELGDTLSDGTKCVAPMFFMEPDIDEVIRAMRWLHENREDGKRLGMAASRRARLEWTWDHVADVVEERLRTLAARPIVRLNQRFEVDASERKSAPDEEVQEAPATNGNLIGDLERALIRGEFEPALGPLREILKLQTFPREARQVLLFAEKSLGCSSHSPHAASRASYFPHQQDGFSRVSTFRKWSNRLEF